MASQTVRGIVLTGLIETLESFNINSDTFLGTYSLAKTDVGNINAAIPLSSIVKILRDATQLSNDPLFCLKMGQQWTINTLGPFSLVVIDCHTFEDFINKVINYIKTFNQGFEYILTKYKNAVTIEFNLRTMTDVNHRPLIELIVSRFLTVTRVFLGKQWNPKAVIFRHPPCVETQKYKRVLGCKVAFEAEQDGLVLGLEDLNHPVNISTDHLRVHIKNYLNQIASPNGLPLIEQLKLTIGDLYNHQQECTLKRVANILSMPERTLQYQLQQEGSSYREVLKDVQSTFAKNMLIQRRATIKEVAEILGFSDQSAFSRAFKQWYGYSPSKCL